MAKKLKFPAHPSLKWLTFAQCKHDPKVKAVRVNGKITEVKQPQDRSNSKMGDHRGSIDFVYVSGRNIRQIRQILPNFNNQLELRKNSNVYFQFITVRHANNSHPRMAKSQSLHNSVSSLHHEFFPL